MAFTHIHVVSSAVGIAVLGTVEDTAMELVEESSMVNMLIVMIFNKATLPYCRYCKSSKVVLMERD
jgi:short-subunit dehydrogenase